MSDHESLFDSDNDEEKIDIKKRKIEVNGDGNVDDIVKPMKKQKKAKEINKSTSKSVFIDDQAVRDSDEEGDDSSDEDESVGDANEYVEDGFVVRDYAKDGDDGIEDDDSANGSIGESKPVKRTLTRLKKGGGQSMLDQEDIDLIAENAGVDRGDGRGMDEDDDGNVIAPERVKVIRKKPKVFGDEDGAVSGGEEESDGEDEEGDVEYAFMAGERGEVREERGSSEGRGRERYAPLRGHYRGSGGGGGSGPSRDAMDEAVDIFGDGYDEYNDDVDDEEDDDMFADETTEHVTKADKDILAVRAQYEHSELVESFCADSDDVIRALDYPERLIQVAQSLTKGKLSIRVPSTENERGEEAYWIKNRLVADKVLEGLEYAEEEAITKSIEHVLKFYHVDHMDVPFVWANRKDYLQNRISRPILWNIYKYDAEWCKFAAKRNHLLSQLHALEDVQSLPANDTQADTRSALVIAELESSVKLLELNIEDAAIEYNRLKTLSSLSDATPIVKESELNALNELENLKLQLKQVEISLKEETAIVSSREYRRQLSSKYTFEMATQVLHLFPIERYKPLLLSTQTEMELRDVSKYFNTIMKACMINNAPSVSMKTSDVFDSPPAKPSMTSTKRIRVVTELDHYFKHASNQDLRLLIESFAVSASDLGDGIRHGLELKVEPLQPDISAEESAAALIDGVTFTTVEDVLYAARVVISAEIAYEPSVRHGSRTLYRTFGSISTNPTPKGLQEINPFHPLFGIHYLREKPLSDFFSNNSSLFAQIIRAESDGLIHMTINPPRDVSNLFLHNLKLFPFFMPTLAPSADSDTSIRSSWDSQRLFILIDCIEKFLVPYLQDETKRELIRSSREAIVTECCSNFRQLLSIGPYRNPDLTLKDVLLKCPHKTNNFSVACIYVPSNIMDPLCMAYITSDGLVKSTSLLPHKASTQKRDRIYTFIKENRPNVIVLNATGGDASRGLLSMIDRYLVSEVSTAITRETEEAYALRDDYYDEPEEDEKYSAKVLLVKDEIAQIFAGSKRSRAKFPDFEPGVCAAISLARYVQEPLTEICSMWSSADATGLFGTEVLFLDLHPLKDLLRGSKAILITALEQVLTDAVCDVGIDLNFALTHDHAASMLAFIGGLGLRKADALRRDIPRKMSYVSHRKHLLERKVLPKIVYNNCAGFLRICEDGNSESEYALDPLDDTRIHPEVYNTHNFAPKICSDALEVPLSLEYNDTVLQIMENSKDALRKKLNDYGWLDVWKRLIDQGVERTSESLKLVLSQQEFDDYELKDLLSELELNQYVEDLQSKGYGKRGKQCELIKEELRYPWLDIRKPLVQPTPYEVFRLVTKANDYVLHVGLHVSCQINEIKEKYAVVIAEGLYRGFVALRNASNDRIENMYVVLKPGMKKEGVVVGVDKEKQTVDISFKDEHLMHDESHWMRCRRTDEFMSRWWDGSDRANFTFDPFFAEDLALSEYSQAVQLTDTVDDKVETAPTNNNRLVYHPLFENCSYKQAEASLRERGVGHVIFRPSSKGASQISITWAFQPNIFKHIDVLEKNKRVGDLGLSNELEIVISKDMKEIFHDLDDIYAGYVQPLNEYTRLMVESRAFCKETIGMKDKEVQEYVDKKLNDQYRENPSRTPYLISLGSNNGGCFVLSWLTQSGPKSVFIPVTSKGYVFEGAMYPKPSTLLSQFKLRISKNNSNNQQ